MPQLTILAYLKLQLPPSSAFELRPSPGKGWGGFALKNIARGDLILTETPLFVVNTSNKNAVVNGDVVKGFINLAPTDKQQLACVRDNGNEIFSNFFEAFEQNSFQPAGSPHRSLYVIHSRFNHSCVPIARIPIEPRDICQLVAAKDISAGEEITFSYSPSEFFAMTRNERHQRLGFTCDCKACLLGTPFQGLSEMRRRFLGGLQYLMRGVDIDGKRDTSAAPLICDHKLKNLAEDNNLPLSSSFVFLLLFICLSEAEGILDDADVEEQEKELRKMAATFKTSKNFRVAERAMQQPTWPGRFWVALGVWLKFDDADYLINLARMMDVSAGRR